MPPDRGIQASVRVSNTGPLDWDRRCICPACFPAQSIRSNHPPSMRAWRPAQTAGTLITLRASRVRPIQPTLPAHTICARSKTAFLAFNLRGSRAARGWLPSRGRAARPTGSPIARNCGARRHLHSCASEHQRPPAVQGAPGLSLPI